MMAGDDDSEVTVESLMENLGIDEAQARFYLREDNKSCCVALTEEEVRALEER